MQVLPVGSYADYRNLVKGKKLVNNGFLPEEINKYITQKRLSHFQIENQLFLLYDEVNYYQLVCEGVESHDIHGAVSFELSKPIVCHIVENNKSNLTADVAKILQKSGFHLRCTIHEYIREKLSDLPVVSSNDFVICNEIKKESDCHDIVSLWQNNLPLYEITYMLPEDVQVLADKKQVIYLRDSCTGQIAGACFYDIFLGTTTIHHIVTSPLFRGKGCAVILLSTWLEQAKRAGAKAARSWIEDTNISSQKGFFKVGFSRTANLSYQYIKSKM